MDEPEEISMEELTAYDRNLGIGDQVIIGPDETLFPLDMAENLGMFDEIDPLSQISETDPRQCRWNGWIIIWTRQKNWKILQLGNKPKFMKINPLKAEKLMEMNYLCRNYR